LAGIVANVFEHRIHCDFARDFSRRRSSHAVANHKNPTPQVETEIVLVICPNQTDVGFSRGLNYQIHFIPNRHLTAIAAIAVWK
jgi:hypothetical protein